MYKENEIKKGVKLHIINNDKFKTNLIAIFMTTPITRENVTKNALLTSVLRRGCMAMQTQEQISKELEEMYGACFDCGLDKTGDNQILKFYMEVLNDDFLPQKDENMLKTAIQKIFEIAFNPLVECDGFKEEYVLQEKENIKRIIEGKSDNKARYAIDRCIEEMYKDRPFGLYKYGYIDDLEKIDNKNLYSHYKELIANCKIDIFVSGNVENIDTLIEENDNIKNIPQRAADYVEKSIDKKENLQEKFIQESMDVTQGKIVIGLDINLDDEKSKYSALVYNNILGGSANSKLFQEVREKASLAYTASSRYIRHKQNIFINCGIEICNFDKALKIIRKQLDDMNAGKFSDEDLENAKKGIISGLKSIDDEQDTEITYFFGQELANTNVSINEYINIIQNITRDDVTKVANSISINTIYFLKN
jgi:predicted Zn-dependent peptidase